MRTLPTITLLCLLGLAACTERKPPSELRLQDLVSKTAPKPQHPLSMRFADKLALVGYEVDVTRVKPGIPFHVVWYWHVLKAPGQGLQQFTHAVDGRGVSRLNLDEARPLAALLPPSEWKAGTYVKDVQEITLPEDWNSDTVSLRLGFWGDAGRMPITAGRDDGETRVIGLTLPVVQGGPPPVASVTAGRLRAPLTLDGVLDEADWGKTVSTGAFVNTIQGTEGAFAVKAWLLYDAEALYVGFDVSDDYLKNTFEKHDEHLWEQDCVEVMIDPDGDEKNYFEMQVSPLGVRFDTFYDTRRRPQPFGHVAWDSQVRAGVKTRGTPNDDEGDEGYTVEMAIPWAALRSGSTVTAPPKAGDTFRVNLFVMDARRRGIRAVGWSPPMVGDFHRIDRFGEVHFPEAAEAPPPAEPAPGEPATAAPGGAQEAAAQ